jgi:hypothetical protein
MFRRMLRLPYPTLTLKKLEVDYFLKVHDGGMKFRKIFLTSPTSDDNAIQVEVCSSKYPYKEFAWIFSRIIR